MLKDYNDKPLEQGAFYFTPIRFTPYNSMGNGVTYVRLTQVYDASVGGYYFDKSKASPMKLHHLADLRNAIRVLPGSVPVEIYLLLLHAEYVMENNEDGG